MFWDFITLRPETCHQVSFLFGDRGIPDGYRHMNGYGSHTFKLVNDKGVATYAKFHFKVSWLDLDAILTCDQFTKQFLSNFQTDQGIKNLPAAKAGQLAGENPDYSIQDLYNAIANGNPPSWTLYLQVMSVDEAERVKFNPFDVTKVWPQSEYPLIPVGRMVLNRNPANYFAEVEQIAFAPSHLIPGVEASPDKMLQGRLFSYADTHRHRLGANYLQIPVNCPFKVKNYQRDGPMTINDNQAGAPNYYPNSFSGPEHSKAFLESSQPLSGDAQRYDSGDEDNFSQVGIFWRKVLDEAARQRLIENMSGHLKDAADFIQQRAITNFSKCDPEYGRRLKEALEKHKSTSAATHVS